LLWKRPDVAQFICRYRKDAEVRWISHLDLKRTLERAMRRAQLPLELTHGHNPHLKLSLGPPLSLGATSDAEVVAVHLTEIMDPDRIKEALNAQLPEGLRMIQVWTVPGHRRKETFGDLNVAEYAAVLRGEADLEGLPARIEELMGQPKLVVERGGERPERRVDVRPLIYHLEIVSSEPGQAELHMRLGTGSHGGVRPQEVLSLLGLGGDDSIARCHRTGLYAKPTELAPRRPGLGRGWGRARKRRTRS
jgi:radical SAM-linked protein